MEEDSHFEIVPGLNTEKDNILEDIEKEKPTNKIKNYGKFAEV